MLSNFFGNIEKKTGVNMNEVMKLVQSLQNADLKDEKTVRSVIRELALIAKKEVPKEKEEKIVKAILNNEVPKDFSSLLKMMDKKKK
ncbi:stage VI sporulation protein F [Paenisporosarcina sp. TG20]|uniref:stage VI sporulation protein F n=1 Tax=Paenisporosarcina sp. TG20 TaxID=1211706 RepID=UPI0002EEA010|nr:stage VI sporulation protein F [Paenisporosarcina sp. TG20]